jgi:hypothetical protein
VATDEQPTGPHWGRIYRRWAASLPR